MKYAVGDRIQDKVIRNHKDGSQTLEYSAGFIEAIGPVPPDEETYNPSMFGRTAYLVHWDRGFSAGHVSYMLIEWVDNAPGITRGVE